MERKKMDYRTKSTILSVLTGVGVVATSVLSARCAKRDDETASKKERIFAYAPAIVSGAATIGLIAASAKVSSDEVTMLTAACAGLAAKLSDYRRSARQVFGEEGAAHIDNEFYAMQAEKVESEEQSPDDGLETFVDSYAGVTFRAKLEDVEKAERDLEEAYREGEPVCWCDLFYLINGNTQPYYSSLGSEIGWSKECMEDMHGDWYGDESDHELPPLSFTNVRLGDGSHVIQYTYDPEWAFYEY